MKSMKDVDFLVICLVFVLVAPTVVSCVSSRSAWRGGREVSPVVLYLCTGDLDYLAPVTVELPREDAVREAARLVVEWQAQTPFRSAFPEGSRLQSVKVDGAVAYVHVEVGDARWDERGRALATGTLAWTLTGFPGITRVALDAGGGRAEPVPRPPFINHVGAPPWDCSMKVTLWFGYRGAYLVPVTKFVPKTFYPHRTALEQLISGPPWGTLARTVPEGTRVLGVSVENGTCTVDLAVKSPAAGEPGGGLSGGSSENLAIQSITITLTEFLDVNGVRVLVNGKTGATLGGHVILDTPLKRGVINPISPGAN